ncbi:MAG: O-antigen ligase family protein [Patescibacteria group bacterium]|nr:O-antigen ligase family protein [Patescibacteria group bacterium]
MKFKEYIFASISCVLVSVILIISDLFDFNHLANFLFILVSLVCMLIAWKNANWLFWLFFALLPLEKVVISPINFPLSLRPYQLIGAILIVVMIAKWVIGKSKFRFISFKKICLLCRLAVGDKCDLGKSQKSFGFYDRLVFSLPIFAFLGLVSSPDRAVSLKLTLVLISFIALFWLARNFLQTTIRRLEALWFFAIGSIPVLLFGIYQSLAFKLGWRHFEVFEARINATFTEPDWFGIYLAFLLALELLFLIAIEKSKVQKVMIGKFDAFKLARGAVFADVFLIISLLIMTVSRSAWLGAAIVILAFFAGSFFIFKENLSYVAGKNLAALALVFVLSFITINLLDLSDFHFANRASSSVSGMQKITISCEKGSNVPREIENISKLGKYDCRHINLEEIATEISAGNEVKEVFRPDPNVQIRKNIYAQSWQQIKKHPILGQGLGSSSAILGKDSHGSGFNASNIFLETWFSMGIGGLAVIVLVLLAPLVKAKKKLLDLKSGKTEIVKNVQFGLLFVLFTSGAIIIPNLFNSGLLLGFFWIWLAAIISVIDEVE